MHINLHTYTCTTTCAQACTLQGSPGVESNVAQDGTGQKHGEQGPELGVGGCLPSQGSKPWVKEDVKVWGPRSDQGDKTPWEDKALDNVLAY